MHISVHLKADKNSYILPRNLTGKAPFSPCFYIFGGWAELADMDSALIDKIPKLLLDASSKIFFKQIERDNYQSRVHSLGALKNSSGAALTFWQLSQDAIEAAGSVDLVSWPEVEQQAIVESIGDNGQSPERVADALCEFSPGAVSKERQQAIRTHIDHVGHDLEERFEKSRQHENDYGSGPLD